MVILRPGDQVDHGTPLCDKVLLCCSKAALTTWWVDNEIDKAFEKEQYPYESTRQEGARSHSLNVDGYLYQWWENGQASQVRSRLAADFAAWEQLPV